MNKLFLIFLIGCSTSTHKIDTADVSEYFSYPLDYSPADASTDANQDADIKVCQSLYIDCSIPCSSDVNKIKCYDKCVNDYRLCTGCSLNVVQQ